MDRLAIGHMQNPVRGFLHGTAAVVSIVGLVALVVRSEGAGMTAASSVYGAALIAMYLTSALYHSVPWQTKWKARLQSLDHTFIYVLVAATLTPLMVGIGEPLWIALGLSGIWVLMVLGLIKELVSQPTRKMLLSIQFVAVGVVLVPAWMTLIAIDTTAAVLTIVGGLVYLLGVLLFVNDMPRLAPRVFSHHEFWHVVVIIASVIHFIAVWRVISTI